MCELPVIMDVAQSGDAAVIDPEVAQTQADLEWSDAVEANIARDGAASEAEVPACFRLATCFDCPRRRVPAFLSPPM